MKKADRDVRYTRGRDFETRIASLARRIVGVNVKRDSKSGGGQTYKSDLAGLAVPEMAFHVECKSHDKIKLGEFWDQTVSHSGYKTPMLILDMGGFDDLCVIRISDALHLLKIINDDSQTIKELRQ